jgi:hypothetical protein
VFVYNSNLPALLAITVQGNAANYAWSAMKAFDLIDLNLPRWQLKASAIISSNSVCHRLNLRTYLGN